MISFVKQKNYDTTTEQLVASENVIRYPQKSSFTRVSKPQAKTCFNYCITILQYSSELIFYREGFDRNVARLKIQSGKRFQCTLVFFYFCFAGSVAALVVRTFCMSLSNSTVVRSRPQPIISLLSLYTCPPTSHQCSSFCFIKCIILTDQLDSSVSPKGLWTSLGIDF